MTYILECKPVDLPIGRRLLGNVSTVGSSVALVCDAVFVTNTTVVTCTSNGIWSPHPSPCGSYKLVRLCCSVRWLLYGQFRHGVFKLDISILFTTFFLWTSLKFIWTFSCHWWTSIVWCIAFKVEFRTCSRAVDDEQLSTEWLQKFTLTILLPRLEFAGKTTSY